MAMRDETECLEDGSYGDRQNYEILQHVGLTVVHIYPQQGTNYNRPPPIEGRSKQSGDTGKEEP